jgi:hypothetical protein
MKMGHLGSNLQNTFKMCFKNASPLSVFCRFDPNLILKSQKGVSFIEIMLSVLILSILLIGFTLVFPIGKNTIDNMGKRRAALSLAQQMMEEIKSQDYEEGAGTFGLKPERQSLPGKITTMLMTTMVGENHLPSIRMENQ